MSIQKINAVAPQFTSGMANGVQNVSVPTDAEQKTINVKNAILVGLGALGVAGLALLAIRRGKLSKSLTSLDEFREKGNQLVKGKAVKANGKPYTGIISNVYYNVDNVGFKTYMEYENGILKSSSKFMLPNAGSGALPTEGSQYLPKIEDCVYKKVYNYDDNGKLVSVVRNKPVPVDFNIRPQDPNFKPEYVLVEDKTFDIKKMQNVGKQRGLLRAIGNKPILDSNLANGYQVFKHNADKIPGMEKVKSYEDFLKALDLEETDVKNGKLTNKAKERLKKLWEKRYLPETLSWNELLQQRIKDIEEEARLDEKLRQIIERDIGAYKNANL